MGVRMKRREERGGRGEVELIEVVVWVIYEFRSRRRRFGRGAF